MSVVCPQCSAPMTPGTRYEPDATVSVHLCLECGTEEPPFGKCCKRGVEKVAGVCAYEDCGAPYFVRKDSASYRLYCDIGGLREHLRVAAALRKRVA